MSDKPELIWWNGRICEWGQATVHVTSETASRGINVFEGLRAYWRPAKGDYGVIALQAHLDRLAASARLLFLPTPWSAADLQRGVEDLIGAVHESCDLYVRIGLYLDQGRYTADASEMRVGSFIAAYPVPRSNLEPVSTVVSSWRRVSDNALPTSAKVGAAYASFRQARIEAHSRGVDEPILLNDRGTVSETAGASVFIVRRGTVLTPPLSEGILDGITRRIACQVVTDRLGLPMVEQPLSRSDLLAADEVFLAGTLDEIKPVASVDGMRMPAAPGPITETVRSWYDGLRDGEAELADPSWIHVIPPR
jgi:branched-chain amino acid aminotransferase